MAKSKEVKVTSSTRDISELNVLIQIMLKVALDKIREKGINPLIVETYRPQLRQYYLYGQGRTPSQCAGAGMPKKYADKYARSGARVTWTLNSIHIKRCAVDLIPQRNGKAIWNTNDKETQSIITIMQKVGFEAGANWVNSPDSPHFQVDKISVKKKTFNPSNTNQYLTKMIQRQLQRAGFYRDYTIDGIWGTATKKAIYKWKKSLGWKKINCIGTRALKKLLSY